MAGKWTPETPWFGGDKKTQAVWPTYVCKNPSCKSYGKSHPNCECGAPSFSQQSKNLEYDASGGEVGRHFCESGMTHMEGCEHFADGGQIAQQQEFASNPDLALDHSVMSHGLLHLLTKTGRTKSEEPGRVMQDQLEHHKRGRGHVENHAKSLLDKSHKIDHDEGRTQALKKHIDEVQQHPAGLLDIGGTMGEHLPEHAGALGAKAATAVSYLESIKPKSQQMNPMSEPIPPNKGRDLVYDRQVAIAEDPALIYRRVKNGTINQDDIRTVQTLYPKLFESMKNKATEMIIGTKSEGKDISYKYRIGLGILLGQPLDYSMSPEAMQAIISANGPAKAPEQTPAGKSHGGRSQPTAQTQKTIEKTDQLYETPIEERRMNQKA